MAKGRRKIGECTYCGKTAELTNDHVVPRALFTPPYPSDLITVPACAPCNSVNKSRGDTILRDYLSLDLFGSQSIRAQAVYPKVLRANSRGQSDLARKIVSQAVMRPLFTTAGIYLGHYPTAKLEKGTIEEPLSAIVRGLYFYRNKTRLPDDYQIEIRRIYEWDLADFLQSLNPLQPYAEGPYFYGDVFGYTCFVPTTDPTTSLWLLWFYNKVCFIITTGEPGIVLAKGRSLY